MGIIHIDFETILTLILANDISCCNFREAGCEETRCYLTADRRLLGSVSNFDAVVFHQRSFTFKDAPPAEIRRGEQRYVHWMYESPALFPALSKLGGKEEQGLCTYSALQNATI